ncbi:MAG: endoflagellar filament sheath protein [Leptospiraceae bacterium]|nr:endoflagellar filament sheath protein [Leptospiraceae bacterium]MBK7057558.1 endoflagellar filament sheath protein [Leptospiraceae bacterium]MBK9500642.1 endoflagellar filament sheath protein [Leptospiraceae bacterium]MBP9162108.1 endoflagellar filament sheath protein [Leptospiraceae bacterium]
MREYMNNKKKLVGILSSIIAIAIAFSGIAYAEKKGLKTTNGNDLGNNELKSITLETWDKVEWEVFTDKDSELPDNYGKKPYKKDLAPSTQSMRQVKLLKGYPRDVKYIDLSKDKDNSQVLAVKFHFTFPGNNEVTIRPPRTADFIINRPRMFINDNAFSNTEAQKAPEKRDINNVNIQPIYGVELPGVTKSMSVWVLGRGIDYILEGWFEDYKGDTHVIKFGSVNFVGWRPMTAVIPANIPQFVEAYPATKSLVFKQFKLRSTPKTGGDITYLFFDELKILADTFDVHFDGANIDFDPEDCSNKQRVEEVEAKAKGIKPVKDCGNSGGAKSAPAAEKK